MREVYCEILQKELKLPEKCERIVSFSPAITEALFAMGLGEKVVGVSVYCVRPEQAREKVIVGSYSSYKKEKLRELNPDVIFTVTGYQMEFAFNLSQEFEVYTISLPTTVVENISLSVECGIVAGYYEEARRLERELTLKLNEVLKKRAPSLRVYVEIDLGGSVTFGAYSYITDALELLGGKNICSDHHREWLYPNDQEIARKNPEVIIYEPKMFKKRRDQREVMEMFRKRFGEVEAIRNERVYLTPGIYDFLAHHGPSFITDALPFLVQVLEVS